MIGVRFQELHEEQGNHSNGENGEAGGSDQQVEGADHADQQEAEDPLEEPPHGRNTPETECTISRRFQFWKLGIFVVPSSHFLRQLLGQFSKISNFLRGGTDFCREQTVFAVSCSQSTR